MFLANGHKLGSYYEVENVLEESILRVYQIVGKAGSTIDVLTSPQEDSKMYAGRQQTKIRSRSQAAAYRDSAGSIGEITLIGRQFNFTI